MFFSRKFADFEHDERHLIHLHIFLLCIFKYIHRYRNQSPLFFFSAAVGGGKWEVGGK